VTTTITAGRMASVVCKSQVTYWSVMRNKSIAGLALLGSMAVRGEVKSPPPYLKDAVIELKLKNGDTYVFPGKDWMVVRRDSLGKTEATVPDKKVCPICQACQEPKINNDSDALLRKIAAQNKEIARLTGILTSTAEARPSSPTPCLPSPTQSPPVAVQSESKLNRVSAIVGLGLQYAVVEDEFGQYLSTSLAPIAGVQYSRVVFDEYSVVLGAMSNQTYLLGVGYDW